MIDVHSIEFYVLALVVAVALVGLFFGERQTQPAASRIITMDVMQRLADEYPAGEIRLTMSDIGVLTIFHAGVDIAPGQLLNVVVTMAGSKVKVVEKLTGSATGPAEAADVCCTVHLQRGVDRYHVRYESPMTGQWCLMTIDQEQGSQSRGTLAY